ncbi:hypothetical protein [Flagellimonas sp.]|uniref:hypothetical protein n=1 Tax=Flagellimonas sp. TaxID=2058762 RepID=UPI003B52A0EE
MKQEILILQSSPRVEVVFTEHDLEVRKSGSVLIKKTSYTEIKKVEFIKGNVPWITGILTMVIDLITGHGVGHWKRGKGTLELSTNAHSYSIGLVNYDREQTRMAVERINNKLKTN